MTTPCPEAWTIHRYRSGLLPAAEAGAFEAHAFGCARCRAALELAGTPEPALAELPRRRRGGAAAAAAAALLAAGVWTWRSAVPAGGAGGPRLRPEAPLPEAFPEVSLEGGGLAAAQGASVLAAPGARLQARGREVSVAAGTAWLEQVGGEPLALALPGGRLLLSGGLLAVEAGAQPRAAWIRSAEAAQGEAPAAVLLDGTARLEGSGFPRTLRAGQRLLLRDGAWAVEDVPAPGLGRLRQDRLRVLEALPGRDPEGAPGAYRWVLALSGRGPATEMRLRFPAGGAWREWPAGLAARAPEPRETLEVGWDGAWLWARDGGRLRFACPASALDRELPAVERAGWDASFLGLGGEAKLTRSVLLEGSSR